MNVLCNSIKAQILTKHIYEWRETLGALLPDIKQLPAKPFTICNLLNYNYNAGIKQFPD